MFQIIHKLFAVLELMRGGEAISIAFFAAETGCNMGLVRDDLLKGHV